MEVFGQSSDQSDLDNFYGQSWEAMVEEQKRNSALVVPTPSPISLDELRKGVVLHPFDVAKQDPRFQPRPR